MIFNMSCPFILLESEYIYLSKSYNETFPMPFFTESSWNSHKFTTKRINCKQTSLLLTNQKYLFYYKLDLYFKDLELNDILQFQNLYS